MRRHTCRIDDPGTAQPVQACDQRERYVTHSTSCVSARPPIAPHDGSDPNGSTRKPPFDELRTGSIQDGYVYHLRARCTNKEFLFKFARWRPSTGLGTY